MLQDSKGELSPESSITSGMMPLSLEPCTKTLVNSPCSKRSGRLVEKNLPLVQHDHHLLEILVNNTSKNIMSDNIYYVNLKGEGEFFFHYKLPRVEEVTKRIVSFAGSSPEEHDPLARGLLFCI